MTTLPPQQCVRGFAGPCRERPQPRSILTDLPQFECAFTNSPGIASPRNSPPSAASPMRSHSAFPKVHVPQSTWSTDSEVLSDNDHRLGSPSLISSIFSRNTGSSCSTSSHVTPITPTGSKPILRRPDCASASTSASEDGGRIFDGRNGLGLSSLISSNHALSRKRSTLTFAVKCPVTTSDSCHSPMSSFNKNCRNYAKSPARQLPAWQYNDEDEDEEEEEEEDDEAYEYCGALIDEDDESDDEGYQEDEEGGFTDDEDLVGTLTRHASNLWVASAKWKARHPSRALLSREGSYISASEDGHVYQPRGRKVSIATSKPDRCSRHVSPPPSRSSSPPPPSCPPAARSPSAIGLCRRRETAKCDVKPGWRLDDSNAFRLGAMSNCKTPSNPASLAGPSILRPCSSVRRKADNVRPPSTVELSRRSSAPASSRITPMAVNGETMRCTAQKALEAFVRRGSDK